MSRIVKLTNENFDSEIVKDGVVAVVDFYADWCTLQDVRARVRGACERENRCRVRQGEC